jgi:hypothetical protein
MIRSRLMDTATNNNPLSAAEAPASARNSSPQPSVVYAFTGGLVGNVRLACSQLLPLLLDTAQTPDWLRYAGDHTALSKQRRDAEWRHERRDRRARPDPGLAWSTFGPPAIGAERFATVSSGASSAQSQVQSWGNKPG